MHVEEGNVRPKLINNAPDIDRVGAYAHVISFMAKRDLERRSERAIVLDYKRSDSSVLRHFAGFPTIMMILPRPEATS